MNAGQFVNQHSYLILGVAVLAILAVILQARRARRVWLVWGGLVVVMATGWFVLRTGAGAPLDSVEAIEAAAASGKPTLVEFYSNY
jgi:drug/metabolite transporter superfamily protein YnfA